MPAIGPLHELEALDELPPPVVVDVDTERVLHLARARGEVAAGHDVVNVEAHRLERPNGQLLEIGVEKIRIEVDADRARGVLEEGIVEMPRSQVAHRDREAMRDLLVELRLP